MRTRRLLCFTWILCVALPGSMANARTIEKYPRKTVATKNWRKHGQQVMDAKRVREIQAALIRENYLKGRPAGVWNERSKAAMARFQSDNRWQSKVVPDSRALIKLGLGPDYAGLINRDTAAISFIPGGGTPSPYSAQR